MTPVVRFYGQPFDEAESADAFLRGCLKDPGVGTVSIVVAWVRFGGIGRLAAEIDAFRESGGKLRIILGIDEGVATRPGLVLAHRLADEAYVFHDRAARTFHPKLYLAEGEAKASVLVGSANMTAGGLLTNYEASLKAEFALPEEENDDALTAVHRWLHRLMEDEQLCLPLSEDLIDELCRNPRYAVADGERRRLAGRRPSPADEEIFGESRHVKASVSRLPDEVRQELAGLEGGGDPPTVVSAEEPAEPPDVRVIANWAKKLSASDAQHPPSANSHPLGNVRLTRGYSRHDWRIWFREELFGGEHWDERRDGKGNPTEVAMLPFSVAVDGEDMGVIDLEIDHAPHRESGQDNHATVLHWGPLAKTLRETDYTGYILSLEKLSDDSYRLEIAP